MHYYTYLINVSCHHNNPDLCIRLADSMLAILHDSPENQMTLRWRTDANNAIANALFQKGSYDDAYNYYFKAQKLAKDHSDQCAMRSYAYSLAMVLYRQQRYAEAVRQFIEAYDHSSLCSQDFNIFYFRQEVLDNIGLCYSAMHRYDSAMYYYNAALRYLNTNSNTNRYDNKRPGVYEAPKGVIYGNMAQAYLKTGHTDSAKLLLSKSIDINLRKSHANSDALADQVKLAELYISTNELPAAWQTLLLIKTEMDTIKVPGAETDWNKQMWRYYQCKGDSVAAYRYLQAYVLMSQHETEANKALMATDLDARVRDIERQHSLDTLMRNRAQQRTYLIILSVFAVMAIAIIILVWRASARSRRSVVQLTALNATISDQKLQLELALQELRKKDSDQIRILKSVAHDVMNPIAAVISLTDILNHTSDNLTPEQKELIGLIADACNNALHLSNDILEATTDIDHTLVKEEVNINQLVARCIELNSFRAFAKRQVIHFQEQKSNIIAWVNADKIRRILNNLIYNAIKFSHTDSAIEINLSVEDGQVTLSVKDQGVGIPEKNKAHVFDMFTEAQSLGTSGERSHGLGLSISMHIARAHNGTIWFSSEEGKGSVFYLQFPATASA